jgi:hypothetical protein
MQFDVWMLVQERLYLRNLMRGQVVQKNMDLLLAPAVRDDLLREGNEFITVVSGSRFAMYLPGPHL